MIYVGGVFLGLVVLLAALFVYGRMQWARNERRLREEIEAYVTSKGGTVTFDAMDGMNIEGPLGNGHQNLTALRIMLASKSGDRNLTIGFALRKYLPDQFDAVFAESAKKRLDEARAPLDALSSEELMKRLRLSITITRTGAVDLTTCARPITDDYEARVVLDGFDLAGIPTTTRAKLEADDAALFETALLQSVGAPPAIEAGEADRHVWLAVPEKIFGRERFIVAGVGKKLAWIPATSENAMAKLSALANQSLESGALKGVVFGWDGARLTRVGMAVHTIKGPTTPDFTMDLDADYCAAFGFPYDPRGIGVSRPRANS